MLTVQNNAIELQVIDGKVVMTSLQVAEIFNKRHDDVLKAIRNEIKSGVDLGSFAEISYKDSNNRTYPAYSLDRDAFTNVVMDFHGKEAKQFKVAYIRAFNHMEAQLLKKAKAPSIPTNFAEALQLAANQAFTIIEQQKQLEEAKPAVALLDKIIANDKTYSMGEAAKLLGWGRNTFIAFLRQQNILDGNNIAYQTFIDRGYFEIKQTIVNRTNGDVDNHVVSRTNDKGIAYISKIMDKAAEALTI